ncbi:MAG: N-acetyltransferase family protein [Halarchaeum sp.]
MTGESQSDGVPAEPFPVPPVSFTDAEDRDLVARRFDSADEDAVAALVSMYEDFDPGMRAQGIPPVGEERIRSWLSTLLESDGYNVVVWDADRAVGHATLVPDGEDQFELAIFVHQDYQGSGVGTRLICTLLGYGAVEGVGHVWLTVERWNNAAVALYEKVGFETTNAESFELEMERDLSTADVQTERTG